MVCPVCGNNVPDGTAVCPVCGASLVVQPNAQAFDMQNQGMAVQGADMVQGGGKKTGLIIAIVASVLVIGIGIALFFILGGGGNKDGRYKASYLGMINIYIDIKGSKGTFSMEVAPEFAEFADSETNQSYDFDASWKGNTLVMSVNGETLEATYDASKKTLTIPDDSELGLGVELVFEKEEK